MALNTLSSDPPLLFDPCFLHEKEAYLLYHRLLEEVPWKQEQIRMFGKWLNMPRLTAWMGDADAVYEYSGLVNQPMPWHSEVLELKLKIEAITKACFNSVLLNYYRNGSDSMGWHSDDEASLGEQPLIASISLGSTRKIRFRRKTGGKSWGYELPSGSLLVMLGEVQENWQHALPKNSQKGGRINLTFRRVYPSIRS